MAAKLLALGLTVTEVARKVRRGRQCVSGWKSGAAFAAEMERQRAILREELRDAIELPALNAMRSALELCRKTIVDPEFGTTDIRLKAARIALQFGARLYGQGMPFLELPRTASLTPELLDEPVSAAEGRDQAMDERLAQWQQDLREREAERRRLNPHLYAASGPAEGTETAES